MVLGSLQRLALVGITATVGLPIFGQVLSPAPLDNAALTQSIAWTIGHEGCPVYVNAGGGRADRPMPPERFRDCYLSVQQHNAQAQRLFLSTPAGQLPAAIKDAIEYGKNEYRVRENLEWVLIHEAQLDNFKSLVTAENFVALRARYAALQRHNPNARNALNLLSDSEIASLVTAKRVSVKSTAVPDLETLQAITRLTSPTVTQLAAPTALADLALRTYGSTHSRYIDVLRVSNALPATTDIVAANTDVVLPSIPGPNALTVLPLRAGLSSTEVVSRINQLPNTTAEEAVGGRLERPVIAQLQSVTKQSFPDQGAQWFAKSIQIDKLVSGDLKFIVPVVVGVIDGGVAAKHPSIAPVLWRLPVELESPGWPRGSIGYDFYSRNPDPAEELANSHGTHVTGLATGRQLATWVPALDAAGLSKNVSAFSLKIAGADGRLDFSTVENAIASGIDKSVRIFNLSLIGPYSQLLHQYLGAEDRLNSVLFIVAAGNVETGGVDLDKRVDRHASFRTTAGAFHRNVIVVGALNDLGQPAPFSNFGRTAVTVWAPGVEITSTISPNTFGRLSGSSQAAPLVTLTAAMLRSQIPNATPLAVKNRIVNTCDYDPPSSTNARTNGCKLNVLKATISTADLIELKGGALLRGDIVREPLAKQGEIAADLVRVFQESPTRYAHMWRSGEKSIRALTPATIAIRLRPGNSCPTTPTAGVCTVAASTIRDIVFRSD